MNGFWSFTLGCAYYSRGEKQIVWYFLHRWGDAEDAIFAVVIVLLRWFSSDVGLFMLLCNKLSSWPDDDDDWTFSITGWWNYPRWLSTLSFPCWCQTLGHRVVIFGGWTFWVLGGDVDVLAIFHGVLEPKLRVKGLWTYPNHERSQFWSLVPL